MRTPPAGVRSVLRLADGIASFAGVVAIICLVLLLFFILAEVFTSLIGKIVPGFSINLNVAWEYSSYLMGGVFLFGATAGMRAGSHVRVSVLLARTSGMATLLLEALATAIGLGVAGYLTWALYSFTMRAWTNGQLSSASLTPLWVPDALLTFAALLMTVQMAARLIRVVFGLPPDETALQMGSGE